MTRKENSTYVAQTAMHSKVDTYNLHGNVFAFTNVFEFSRQLSHVHTVFVLYGDLEFDYHDMYTRLGTVTKWVFVRQCC